MSILIPEKQEVNAAAGVSAIVQRIKPDPNRSGARLSGLISREHTIDFVRKALFESRDSAMAVLRRSRGEDVNVAKFVRD
ncbi:hypothetical protein MTR72_05900 [Bradyrhizobium sp. ISRA442]|uniref:hypothetical protein n=1 Tax=Bradyrhizobium sp. ISRA442 TaxID=2866197 RepID=UPI00311AC70C